MAPGKKLLRGAHHSVLSEAADNFTVAVLFVSLPPGGKMALVFVVFKLFVCIQSSKQNLSLSAMCTDPAGSHAPSSGLCNSRE